LAVRDRGDAAAQAELTHILRGLPGVAGVSWRSGVLASFEQFTGTLIWVFAGVLALFAGAIIVGVVYNGARIILAEQNRELATLRVLGFTTAEVARVVQGELGLQVALAIPLGSAIGLGLTSVICQAMDSDLMRLPRVVEPSTYALAVGLALAATVIVAKGVLFRVRSLDLCAVLKTKD
jgi:putative ABC transport system permease protein